MRTTFAICITAVIGTLAASAANAQVRLLDYTPSNRGFVRPLYRFNLDGSYYNSLSIYRSVRPQKGRLESRRFPSRQSTYRETSSTPSYRYAAPTYSFRSPAYRVSTPRSSYNNGASVRYQR